MPAATRVAPPHPLDGKAGLFFHLDEARKRCGPMFGDMVDYFFQEADVVLDEIRAAVGQGEAAEAGRLAHRLKGTVAYLATAAAIEPFRKMEQLAAAGTLAEMAGALERLEEVVGRLKESLAPHRAGQASV